MKLHAKIVFDQYKMAVLMTSNIYTSSISKILV